MYIYYRVSYQLSLTDKRLETFVQNTGRQQENKVLSFHRSMPLGASWTTLSHLFSKWQGFFFPRQTLITPTIPPPPVPLHARKDKTSQCADDDDACWKLFKKNYYYYWVKRITGYPKEANLWFGSTFASALHGSMASLFQKLNERMKGKKKTKLHVD